MKCEQIKTFISERLGENLPQDLQLHLDECATCRALYVRQLMVKDLCSLRCYEEPKSSRVESTVATVMRAVRLHEERYESRQDRLMWLFRDPRYGVAVLFLIFMGLNLVRSNQPMYYQIPLDEDRFGSDIMLLNEAPPAALSNEYNFSDFSTDSIPSVPLIDPVKPNNMQVFDKEGDVSRPEKNP